MSDSFVVETYVNSSVADPGQYSTDPDPADVKKRIRILVKYDYIAHI